MINGNFAFSFNPPSEVYDYEIIKRLNYLCKELTIDEVYLLRSITQTMCEYKYRVARMNSKVYRIKSFINTIIPHLIKLLQQEVLSSEGKKLD